MSFDWPWEAKELVFTGPGLGGRWVTDAAVAKRSVMMGHDNPCAVRLFAVCFCFVWVFCLPCSSEHASMQTVSPTVLVVYFSISAGLFNVGWAAVQVAHMALIPDLTPVAKEQVLLNSGRYCFTVLANLSVFAVFYVLLHFMGTKGSFGEHGFKFKELAYFVLGSGLLASSIFLVGTKEPPAPPSEQKPGGSDEDSGNDLQQSLLDVCTTPSSVMSCQRKRPTDWLKERLFYSVGVVYMCTRLVVNQSQVYIPFYVLRSTSLAVDKVALVPFIVYLSSLVSTYVSKELNQRLGRRPTYFMGTVCVTCGCVCLWFGNDVSALVYVGVILVGWGNSAVMVTSVALEADLIGRNVECGTLSSGVASCLFCVSVLLQPSVSVASLTPSFVWLGCTPGAFVFGALSLTDKLSNGIGVLVIQYMSKMADLSLFYRAVVSFVPAVFVVLAFSVVSLTRMPEILQKSHSVADATSTVDTEARAGLWNSVRTDSLTTENSSVAQTHLRNMSVGQKRDSSAAMTGPTTC